MGVGSRAVDGRARGGGGIARGGPVLCCFGVSEFESSRGRGENFFFFLFLGWGAILIFFSRRNWEKKDFSV